MAEETQTTQTTTEQTAALSGGGDPNTSTPDSVQAEKTFTQAEVNELIRGRSEWLQKKPLIYPPEWCIIYNVQLCADFR